MDKAHGLPIDLHRHDGAAHTSARLDWRKRMSDHVAWSLLVYTALQIGLISFAGESGLHGSIMPYFALVVLVAAVIPGWRLFEARWADLSDDAAADPALAGAFGRDRLLLWATALALPLVMTGFFRLVDSAI